MHKRLFALGAVAALAACGGGSSSTPFALPSASSSASEPVVLNGATGTQQSVTLPSAGGYSGTMLLTFAGTANGVSADLTFGTSPPYGAPAPSGADDALVFVALTTAANVALAGSPGFTFTVPATALESVRRRSQSGTASLQLSLLDPGNAAAGYHTVASCGASSTTVTCNAGTVPLNLVAQQPYLFAVTESVVVAVPTPSPSPSGASGGTAVIAVPTAAPITCSPPSDIVGVNQTNIVVCSEQGYAGPFTISVANPAIASVQPANDLTFTYFSVTGLSAGTTTLMLTSQTGTKASTTITVAP